MSCTPPRLSCRDRCACSFFCCCECNAQLALMYPKIWPASLRLLDAVDPSRERNIIPCVPQITLFLSGSLLVLVVASATRIGLWDTQTVVILHHPHQLRPWSSVHSSLLQTSATMLSHRPPSHNKLCLCWCVAMAVGVKIDVGRNAYVKR